MREVRERQALEAEKSASSPSRRLDPNDERATYADGQIQKLRQRLLDLTNRNRLLNYLFSDRARGQIRVIDEVPDQLFARMQAGQRMWFRPLADPEGEPVDEKHDDFVAAFEAARYEDERYLKGVEELGAEDSENPNFLRVERELKDRVRESLGLPPRPTRKTMSRAEVAREQNLDPAYDLPTSSSDGDSEKKHADNEIQTLLFADEMERKLSFLRDQTRKGHEETGLNTLFAAYGFLEWYESEQSDKKLLSPLIMQPLEIGREKKGHAYRYAVGGNGEPSLVNLSLVERMKEFALAFPDFEEAETPDSYFAKVAATNAKIPRWRVRRYIAIGTFSFGKLAMWHDLDPAKWPLASGLPTHPVVASLLAGTGKPAGDDAEPYNVDTEEVEKRLPPIVTDADASQLCTILDAMEGKSLAVKGPPGTGKSQTITNLIAAAMAKGKRVLFVAEKMAALEVVKNRLDHFGLGDFILELHSTKARRDKILTAIRSRIELSRLPSPSQLTGAQDEVRRLKRQLAAYVDLLNSPIGRTGKTLQEVFWAEARTRDTPLPAALDKVALASAEALSAQDVDRCRSLMRRLEAAHSEATESGQSLSTHPWLGVRNLVPVFQHDALIQSLRVLRDAISQALGVSDAFMQRVGVEGPMAPEELSMLVRRVREIPTSKEVPADAKTLGVLALFTDSEREDLARTLDSRWSVEAAARARFREAFVDVASPLAGSSALASLVSKLGGCESDAGTLEGLVFRLEQVRDQQARWEEIHPAIQRLAQLVGLTQVNTRHDLVLLRRAIESVRGITTATLRRRRLNLLDGNGESILDAIKARSAELKRCADSIAGDLKLDGAIDSAQMREAAATLRTAGFLARLFSPKFNAARCLYEDLSQQRSSDWKLAASQLDSLAEFQDARSAFTSDQRNVEHLGEWFQGVDTEFEPLEEALRFGRAALEIGRQGGCGPALRRFLLEATPQSIFEFAEGSGGEDFRLLDECLQILPDHSAAPIQQLLDQLKNAALRWEEAIDSARAMSLREGFPFAGLPELVAHAEELERTVEACTPEEREFSERLSTLGFTSEEPELRKSVLDLAGRLASPMACDELTWRSTVFRSPIGTALDEVHASAAQTEEAIAAFESAWAEFDSIAAFDAQAALTVSRPSLLPFGQLETWVEKTLTAQHWLPGWMSWLRAVAEAKDEGLLGIFEAYSGEPTVAGLDVAFERVLWRSLAKQAFANDASLARFSGMGQEDARKRFRQLDKQVLELNRKQIRAMLSGVKAPHGLQSGPKKTWTDGALLNYQCSLQRPSMTIRNLILGAHNALQQIKPCWMMSPGSIAQFLPQGLVNFDLVVIDEASQLRPEDAVGATARGDQVVVVGDPMQLPPTSFFDRVDETIEEDDEDVDAESVLDLALSVYHPARNLRWHYRSRHESLVAFSNKEFYERSLIVFPSPHDANETLGVKYRHVAGHYQGRGGNQDEVKAVSEAALRHMRTQPHLSLGVVAVNREQAELLRREIERLVLDDTAAQEYVARWEEELESFFVKNLETVQGDERDVIMISMVYGPNEKGVTYQRFGPINTNVGHRRLNVLFTRAKHRIELFTSMTAADVQPSATSKWGVSAMKRYLEYAATGQLESGDEGGGEPDSDFEVFVADALRQHGYEVRTQVGVAGFRIDLGVRHSSYPHGYLLGIECDGATYHSAKSARDRDALRQEILERLGWRLYRIWSTDWFNDPRRETEKLVQHLRKLTETSAKLSVAPA